MAKSFYKYFFNNLKETKYLSNINRVEIDPTKTDGNNVLSETSLRHRKEELDKIQVDTRHRNMRIYFKNMLGFRARQTFVLAIPTALTIGTVASFVLPYKRVVSKDFSDVYVKESTVLSNTEGEIFDNSDKYYYSSGFFDLGDYDFVDDHNFNYVSHDDTLVYQISDGIDSALAKFSYNSEGRLTFNSVEIGNFIDVSSYDFSDATDIEEKYKNLFSEVIELVKSEQNLSADQLEVLNNLVNSEESKIIIEIINYNKIGEGEAEIYKTRFAQRWFLLIVSGLYAWMLYEITIKDGSYKKGTELYPYDGQLCSNGSQVIGFFHVMLKYKEAFIKAEKDRIKKSYDLAKQYVSEEDVDNLFTSFERKLTNKKER